MGANVDGAWLIARAAGRQMLLQGRGGKVVLTSSARGKLGHPAGYSAYCASKSAIDGMTKALGCEWGKHGITVNAIAPTVFRSPLTAWMFEDTEKAKSVRAGFLAARPRRPPRRARGPGRTTAVPLFARLRFPHRAHRLRRRRLYRGLTARLRQPGQECMSNKVIVTCAITGAMHTPTHVGRPCRSRPQESPIRPSPPPRRRGHPPSPRPQARGR